MTERPVKFDDEASAELEVAAGWYLERNPVLAVRLLEAVEGASRRLAERPRSHPLVLGLPTNVEVRRARLHKFPYALLFVETPSACRVIAIVHLRRRPLYWTRRLEP